MQAIESKKRLVDGGDDEGDESDDDDDDDHVVDDGDDMSHFAQPLRSKLFLTPLSGWGLGLLVT